MLFISLVNGLSEGIKSLSSSVILGDRWQGVNPHLWNERFPNECSKFSQSPIDIKTSETVYDEKLKNFVFINFDVKFQWKADFDGYSGKLRLVIYSRRKDYSKLCKKK